MIMRQIIDDMNNRVVRLTEYGFDLIGQASERLNNGDFKLSTHEFTAAEIVNGRLEWLRAADFRQPLVCMGRSWVHASIELIFDHWQREMELPGNHPQCPIGDQRIFTRR